MEKAGFSSALNYFSPQCHMIL